MLKLGDFCCSRDAFRDTGLLPQVGFTARFLLSPTSSGMSGVGYMPLAVPGEL